MSRNRPLKPLDAAALERLALRYVERYATTQAKLAAYCSRKIRERGWEGAPVDVASLADRFAELGYVNDRLYAESKAAAMGRRGLGERRVRQALWVAGVGAADTDDLADDIEARAVETALAFARRKRIGPFARVIADPATQERSVGAMVRAGHAPGLARRIARMAPGVDVTDTGILE